MSKALTKAQLLGYNWAGAALISISNSFSNLEKGRRTPMVLKTTAREHSNVVVVPPREGTVIIGA